MSIRTSRRKRLELELAASPTNTEVTSTNYKFLTKKDPGHHKHGKWIQSGFCVICICGQRLYKGCLPKGKKEKRDLSLFIMDVERHVQERV